MRGLGSRRPPVLRTAAAIASAGVFVLPLWWVAVSALRPEQEIFHFLSPLSVQTLVPLDPTLQNVVALWSSPFAQAIMNSVLVSAATVLLGLVICSAAAFALAVIDFPGQRIVFAAMVVSFLIPFDAVAVPLYGIMRGLHLQNTYTGLVLPGIGNGLAVFLLRQFFLGLPRDLRDAARMDGAGWFSIFRTIYLPLSGPALVSAALILFVFQWQAYLWPLLIAPQPRYKVAAVAVAEFASTYDVKYALVFAGALFISLIPMGVLLGFQRYFRASVASTGGKE